MALAQITITREDAQKMVDIANRHGSKQWFIAKDEGAYIGITGGEGETFENFIKYFAGCDPNKDEHSYDNARYKFGGDDFGDHLNVDILRKFLANERSVKIVLKVNKSSITLNSFTKKAAQTEPSAPSAAPKAPEAKAKAPKAKAPKAKAPKAKAPTKKPSAVKTTIGAVAMAAIAAGKSNEDALKAVKSSFPKAKTTLGCISWYRSKLNKA